MQQSNHVRDIVICNDKPAISRDAAYRFIALATAAERAGRPFTVALSGGSTPEQLYQLLATPPYRDAIDWSRVQIFFGDERCVPPDAPESNFRMARETLLSKAPIPTENIHRIYGELTDRDAAARRYEEAIRAICPAGPRGIPRFDLILLGLGSDGHCASLFPNQPSLQEEHRLVVVSEPGLAPFVARITFTYPLLNNAGNVLFLAAGEDKAAIVARVLHGPALPAELPSQDVSPIDGELSWLLDVGAGGGL